MLFKRWNFFKSKKVLFRFKLLGFIVSKEGICIDTERIKAISELSHPHNKKFIIVLFRTDKFCQNFVPKFSQITLPLQVMIKKNALFKWGHNEIEAFDLIKQAIINSPSRATLYFSNHFILYTDRKSVV